MSSVAGRYALYGWMTDEQRKAETWPPPSGVRDAKICSCGRHYSNEEWEALGSIGLMEDGDGGWLNLKNCVDCESTMSSPVKP